MTPREIEIFRAVMHYRTVSAAAEVLGVTQPALSKALRHCEDRLGYQLFRRAGGRLVPTAEARALIGEADRLHGQMVSFGGLARAIGGRAGGVLRLGATSSLSMSLVPRAVAQLRREFTDARMVVFNLAVPELEEALLMRRVDVGVALSPLVVPGLEVTEIGRVPCVALVPADHELAARPFLRPAELVELPEVGFGTAQDFGRSVESAFQRDGVQRRLAVEVGATTGAVAMVRAGAGFAIVDALTRDYLPQGVAARPLRPELHRRVLLVRTEAAGTSALTERFQSLLEAFCREV